MRAFKDRHDAGERLAQALQRYAERADVIVLSLPRGGVPVGYEIATRLGLPLDVLVVRKLGLPGHAELAMGAIASGGIQVIDRPVVTAMHVSREAFDAVVRAEHRELLRREREFRGERAPLEVRGKTVLLVDDGLATGSTMLAAIEALRTRAPNAIVVAVPVASPRTCEAIRSKADGLLCLVTPNDFYAVGLWYEDFSQTTDDEVRDALTAADRALRARARAQPSEMVNAAR